MINTTKNNLSTKAVSQAALSVLVVVGVVVISLQLVESEVVQRLVSSLGYIGIFIISVVSGFSIAVPVPTIAFLPLFIGSGFSFWPLLIVMTVGMTAGDAIGYLLGSTGRKLAEARAAAIKDGRVYHTLTAFHRRHRLWPFVFFGVYVSLVPAPNEIIVIPMAFMGYRFRYMLPIMLVGNFIFNTLAAFGINSIFMFL